MSDPFLGEIRIFAFNFAPSGWAICNGQLLPIAQYNALFALLGTTYGGNGTNNFQLPDLQGRAPMHYGQGPGLGNYVQGELVGSESVTLTVNEMPAHSHGTSGASVQTSDRPDGLAPAPGGSYGAPASFMASTETVGGTQAHNNMQPSLVLNFCIATTGIFPSRS